MVFSNRRQPSPANQPPDNPLVSQARTIEGVLQSLSIDPTQARLKTVEQDYGWHFRSGSATIEIYLIRVDGRGYMQVLSPIFQLPMNNLLGLYRRMLEINLSLTNAALGVFFDVVYVFSERPVEGLGPEETIAIITLVAGYADQYDNALVGEFGGRLYGQT